MARGSSRTTAATRTGSPARIRASSGPDSRVVTRAPVMPAPQPAPSRAATAIQRAGCGGRNATASAAPPRAPAPSRRPERAERYSAASEESQTATANPASRRSVMPCPPLACPSGRRLRGSRLVRLVAARCRRSYRDQVLQLLVAGVADAVDLSQVADRTETALSVARVEDALGEH